MTPSPSLQLPIQAPPPCLGHRFLQESHSQVVREMLSVTERVVKGATSVGESLKDILGNMEGGSLVYCSVQDRAIFCCQCHLQVPFFS